MAGEVDGRLVIRSLSPSFSELQLMLRRYLFHVYIPIIPLVALLLVFELGLGLAPLGGLCWEMETG